MTKARPVRATPRMPQVMPVTANPRPFTAPAPRARSAPRRIWRSPTRPSTIEATPITMASRANAPATAGPQPAFAPSAPKQPTMSDTTIEPTPAIMLATAGPLVVGATPTTATANGVPGIVSTATGGGRPTFGRGGRGYG